LVRGEGYSETSFSCRLKDISQMEFLSAASTVLVAATSSDQWQTVTVEASTGFENVEEHGPDFGWGWPVKGFPRASAIRFNAQPDCTPALTAATVECSPDPPNAGPRCGFLRIELVK
jgi:hypothetical protein